MSDAWLSFGASVVGGAVAAAAALGGVMIVQRNENARARKIDQQRLRDLKAKRLRRLYKPFIEFALVLEQVAREKAYVMEGDTREERDRRHEHQMSEGIRRVSSVIAATLIEPGTATARQAYEETYQACDGYLRSLNMNARVPGTTSAGRLNIQFDTIAEGSKRLKATVLAQLEELEDSI